MRTGTLLPIVEDLKRRGEGGLIVVGAKEQPAVQALLTDAKRKTTVDALTAEQYVLKTFPYKGRPVLLVAGGDAIGTL